MSNQSNGSGSAIEQAGRSRDRSESADAKLAQVSEKPDSMPSSDNGSPANNANAKTMQDNG